MNHNSIVVRNIVKRYGNQKALDTISMELKTGIYGLIGQNGAGKSTLLKILTGIITPDSGKITWNGNDIFTKNNKNNYLDIMGYVPQKYAMYTDFTVWEFLEYIALLKNVPKDLIHERIVDSLSMVELLDCKEKKTGILSGGMRQRLMIAQAFLNHPAILFLDEPSSGLDPYQRIVLKKIIKNFSKDSIVLISTHVIADIEFLADELILLKEGRIIKKGSLDNLYKEYVNNKKREVSEIEMMKIEQICKYYLEWDL